MICQCPNHIGFGKHISCTNKAKAFFLNRATGEIKALCGDCTWDIHVWSRDLTEAEEKQ